MEKLIEKNYYLHKSAQEAYKSYVRAYDSHSLKQIYNVNTLNLLMVALSFGFKVPPYVDLSILYKRLTVGEMKGNLPKTFLVFTFMTSSPVQRAYGGQFSCHSVLMVIPSRTAA